MKEREEKVRGELPTHGLRDTVDLGSLKNGGREGLGDL
jgi:hypothetical protein